MALVLAVPATAAAARSNVAALQVALRAKGVYSGTVDGIRGPLTRAGVRRLQARAGLAADGIAGPRTRSALGWRGRPRLGTRVIRRGRRGWDVAALQFLLATRGFPSGSIDGRFGPRSVAALQRFQAWAGLAADGLAGPATLAAVRRPPPRSILSFAAPLPISPTDRFGPRGDAFHAGIDYPAAAGTPVAAAGRGCVASAGYDGGGFGNLVVIQHRLGYTTWYAHLSVITTWVGEQVTGGTRLGYVGSTGHSTGPHLHFELRKNAVPIDPMPYLLQAVATRSSAGGGGAGAGGGSGAGEGGTGGGAAARECPIREPLVRYRRAELDACRAKNLTRAR
jgi:murein DD-endopeptidase MepM/ murein hydrolase activator NlpD